MGKYGVLEKRYHEIQCGICGKWYKGLSAHAWMAHGLLAAQYRELFGLNYTVGLVCDELAEKQSRIMKNRFKVKGAPPGWHPGATEQSMKAVAATRGRPAREQAYNAMLAVHTPTIIKRNCKICGKEYEVTLTDDRLTCGDECRTEDRRRITAQNNPSGTPEAAAKISAKARERINATPETKAQYIERIHKKQKEWQQRVGPEAVAESRRKALASMSPESRARHNKGRQRGIRKRLANLRWLKDHPDTVEAKEAKERHRKGGDVLRKVKREDYGTIKQRVAAGERRSDLAAEYGCSLPLIDQIVQGRRD